MYIEEKHIVNLVSELDEYFRDCDKLELAAELSPFPDQTREELEHEVEQAKRILKKYKKL